MHLGTLFNGLKEHRKPVFMVGVLLLVALAVCMAQVVPMDEDSSGEDGIQGPVLGQGLALSISFIFLSLHMAWTCGLMGKAHAVEYLKGHIGEKRFADKLARLCVHVRVKSLVTVLFGAPSLFYSRRKYWDFLRRPPYIEERLSRPGILIYGGTPA